MESLCKNSAIKPNLPSSTQLNELNVVDLLVIDDQMGVVRLKIPDARHSRFILLLFGGGKIHKGFQDAE